MAGPSSLSRPLPPELLRSVRTGLASYQNYPVFSWPWLRRRTLRFALISGGIGAVIGVALWGYDHRILPALSVFAHFVLGVTLIGALGPALATAVRHRHLPRRREQSLVVVSLLLGLAASAGADAWASAAIETGLRAAGDPSAAPAPAPSRSGPLGEALGTAVALAIYAMLGGGLAVTRYFNEERRLAELAHERELAALQARHSELDARLGLLQAQIEPHFLFNTLASVHALITTDAPAAQGLLDSLVTYLRATIPRLRQASGQLESSLGEQLELCERYLQLMQQRMGDRLHLRVEVAAALRDVWFPPLLLMTLVENAIKHGVEPKRGPGTVTIRATAPDPEHLAVSVSDDGVGLRESSGTGVGLSNLREWLQARYGARATFSLAGGLAGGAEATVTIPLQRSASSRG